jgi:DeoR family transcriptional regulator, catabolite repression regulator
MKFAWSFWINTEKIIFIQNNSLKIEDMLVKDVMLSKEKFAIVQSNAMLKDALDSINEFNLGIACIVNDQQILMGIITDGDIRRKLLKVQKPLSSLFVDDALFHAIQNPMVCGVDDSLQTAVTMMGEKHIWDLPVVNENKELVGLLHLHPAVEALLNDRK